MSNLTNKITKLLGRIVVGGLITTGVVGGGIRLLDFTSTGAVNTRDTASVIVADWLNVAVVSGTGACIANPLNALGKGTGAIVNLSYSISANPTAASADIGFTKDCNDGNGTGHTLFKSNTCTNTGCVFTWQRTGSGTGGWGGVTGLWNGADKIMVSYGRTATGTIARLRVMYEDVFGE